MNSQLSSMMLMLNVSFPQDLQRTSALFHSTPEIHDYMVLKLRYVFIEPIECFQKQRPIVFNCLKGVSLFEPFQKSTKILIFIGFTHR